MPYSVFDDGYPEHRKVIALSDRAFRLDVTGIVYCARTMSDGLIVKAALRSLGGSPRTAADLVRAGRWEPVDGGWIVHGYLEHHKTREKILAEREAARERMANVRANKSGTPSEPPETFDDGSTTQSNPIPMPMGEPQTEEFASVGDETQRHLLATLAQHDELWLTIDQRNLERAGASAGHRNITEALTRIRSRYDGNGITIRTTAYAYLVATMRDVESGRAA